MPHYDYICENCGWEFQVFQPMSDPTKKKCSKCGKYSLRRLIGSGSCVIFKGAGFYETDYKKKK